ncbi:hypothetical protein CPC08DRAFT_715522 [Agrocybe pediades]|nr:hypothetical protein CPC08DRAFT_715522 [Agrocybe pediades]
MVNVLLAEDLILAKNTTIAPLGDVAIGPPTTTPTKNWTTLLCILHILVLTLTSGRCIHYRRQGTFGWDDAFLSVAITADFAMLITFIFLSTKSLTDVSLLPYWITVDLYFFITWTSKAAFLMSIALSYPTTFCKHMKVIRCLALTFLFTGVFYCAMTNLLCGHPFRKTSLIDAVCPIPTSIGVSNIIFSILTDLVNGIAALLLSKTATFPHAGIRHSFLFSSMTVALPAIATIVCWTNILSVDSSHMVLHIYLTNAMAAFSLLNTSISLIPSLMIARQHAQRANHREFFVLQNRIRSNVNTSIFQVQRRPNAPIPEGRDHVALQTPASQKEQPPRSTSHATRPI